MARRDLVSALVDQLERVDREERTSLTRAFLAGREAVAREFVAHASAVARTDPSLDRGWIHLGEALDDVLKEERVREEREERRGFLEELETFLEDCLEGRCVQTPDEEDMMRAYAEGDHYLEAFEENLVEDHPDIQGFISYAGEADRYFERGELSLAGRAYRVLIDIYRHDTGVRHCFVEADEFPDLDLSQVRGVDIGRLEERHRTCVSSSQGTSGD